MNTNQANYGGLINFSLPADDSEVHGFVDPCWKSLRSQLMKVDNNPIFPRRQHRIFRFQAIRGFLFLAAKMLVKI